MTKMKRILFVCTGNTCRSPMAEHLLRHHLQEMPDQGIEVQSAGVAAMPGMSAAPQAIEVLKEKGISMEHSSRPLTEELVEWADVILTMTGTHKQLVLSQFPQSVDKVYILKEYIVKREGTGSEKLHKEMVEGNLDISDPFGGDVEVYRRSAEEIEKVIRELKKKLE